MDTMPEVIQRYQRASDEQDWNTLVACFTDDATVTDEERTYRGRDAIRAWREESARKYTFTSTVLDAKKLSEDSYEITSMLRGNFPGGEATLRSAFSIQAGLIAELRNS